MKKLVQCVIIAFILLTTNAYAEVERNARLYAAQWISDLYSKVEPDDINKIVRSAFEHGAKHRIDPFLILSLIGKESGFNKQARNKSSATGLMQVIPRWHRNKIKGRNLFSIDTNIEVGAAILRECMDRNSQNLNSTLKCYRGANDRKYFAEVKQTRTQLRRWVVENQFKLQLPVYYASIDNFNSF